VGSGPMRFVKDEWTPGARAVFEKFADYVPRSEPASWLAGGKRIVSDRVEWITIADPATAAAALQNGEVDWLELPLPDLVPTLRHCSSASVPSAICGDRFAGANEASRLRTDADTAPRRRVDPPGRGERLGSYHNRGFGRHPHRDQLWHSEPVDRFSADSCRRDRGLHGSPAYRDYRGDDAATRSAYRQRRLAKIRQREPAISCRGDDASWAPISGVQSCGRILLQCAAGAPPTRFRPAPA